jgi:type I restriction enzyme, S subunit
MVTDQLTVKSGYKITSLGCVPRDWNIVPLSKLCHQISDGTHFTPHYVENGVPFYSVENITRRDFENTKFISREDHLQLIKRCKPERGDILMTRITAGIVGDTQLIDWDVDASIYVSLALLKPNEYIHSNYFYQYTKSKAFLSSVEKFALVNATPKKINMADIGKIEIPVPPSIAEQKSIAKSLADTQELIDSLEKVTKKKQNIKQGTIQELLTGKRRLEGFNEEWKSISLGKLFTVFTGKAKSKYVVEFGKYLIMDMGSVSSEGMNICEKQTNFEGDFLQIGDLVMPKDDIGGGKIIGKTVFVDKNKKYVLGDHVYVLRIKNDKNNSKFLSYMINSFWINSDIHKKVTGSAQLGINRKTVEEQIVIIPTDIEEQIRITNIISDMDSEIKELENQRDKYIMIKNGMMQKLLTGEIRLV